MDGCNPFKADVCDVALAQRVSRNPELKDGILFAFEVGIPERHYGLGMSQLPAARGASHGPCSGSSPGAFVAAPSAFFSCNNS